MILVVGLSYGLYYVDRELDYKESWAPKNWCFWTVVLEKTLGSPLGCKEIKPTNPKENQPWIVFGRTNGEALILWSPDANSQLIGKVLDAGKNWRQKEKRVSEDEMAGWHHRCKEHEPGQTPGDGEGQGGLVCCSSWGSKVLDMTGQLNNNNKIKESEVIYFLKNKLYFVNKTV